ncbi:MAG: hypothetical protein AAF682_21655 [Planctomycetota bacterium]
MRFPKNHRPPGRREARRGGVLILSLVTVGVIAMLSVAFLQLSASITRRQVGAVDTKLSFYLAEAGLSESYSGIMIGKTGAIGSEAAPAILGEGLLWVEATELDAEHVELRATGMAKGGRATLGMVVRKGKVNLGSLGVFSEDDLIIEGGTVIDGYDSSLGTYDDQKAADPASVQQGMVGSNGDVTVDASLGATTVLGDVRPGPTGALISVGTPTITGATIGNALVVQLDPVEMPDGTPLPGFTHAAGAPLVVASGTYQAEYLHLQANSEATLQGPLRLALDGLRIDPGAELVLDTSGGPIELLLSDHLDVDAAALLTTTGDDASQVTINIAGEATVEVESAGPFYGLIYAPETSVLLASGFELFGGVVAQQLTMAAGAQLHYDRNLLLAGADDALPKVLSWRIIELPLDAVGSTGGNPFDTLGVDPTTLEAPAQSHQDQWLDLAYIPRTSGVETDYNGLESAFDWNDVQTVVSLERDGGLVEEDVVRIAADGGLGFTP